jgi:oligopeptide/dipeptide ABC transporter ATP-binding protein
MQMIFQDPTASLSPRMRVEKLVTEPYRINKVPADEQYSVRELMELVQLNEEQASKYPHQLSSGQARRVGIARALAMQPDLIVADEPTSGLDVSAAANVLILMDRLRRDMGIAYILISHDLNVVTQVADRIAVMYLGRIVELGPVDDIISKQLHPYTQGLLAAVPQPNPEALRHDNVPPGEVPSPRNPPSGCHFHPRCRFAQDLCHEQVPELIETSADHKVACHFWEVAAKTSPQPVTLNLGSHPDQSTA